MLTTSQHAQAAYDTYLISAPAQASSVPSVPSALSAASAASAFSAPSASFSAMIGASAASISFETRLAAIYYGSVERGGGLSGDGGGRSGQELKRRSGAGALAQPSAKKAAIAGNMPDHADTDTDWNTGGGC